MVWERKEKHTRNSLDSSGNMNMHFLGSGGLILKCSVEAVMLGEGAGENSGGECCG